MYGYNFVNLCQCVIVFECVCLSVCRCVSVYDSVTVRVCDSV